MPQLTAQMVRGWELNTAMGLGYILFGVEAERGDGSAGVKALETALLLTGSDCRSLAAQLVQLADRIDQEGGTA